MIIYYCFCIYMPLLNVFYISVPGQVDNVSLTCDPVELINRCTATWNVSYVHTYKHVFKFFKQPDLFCHLLA